MQPPHKSTADAMVLSAFGTWDLHHCMCSPPGAAMYLERTAWVAIGGFMGQAGAGALAWGALM